MWNKRNATINQLWSSGLGRGSSSQSHVPAFLGAGHNPALPGAGLAAPAHPAHRRDREIILPFFPSYQECTTPGAPRGVFAVPAGAKAGLFARGFFFFLDMKYYY